MTFQRAEGDFYFFKLPSPHPGHESFKGCSGAPIVDSEARVVALVCGGDPATNEIHGIALKKNEAVLEHSPRSNRQHRLISSRVLGHWNPASTVRREAFTARPFSGIINTKADVNRLPTVCAFWQRRASVDRIVQCLNSIRGPGGGSV